MYAHLDEFAAAWERFQTAQSLVPEPDTLESAWAQGHERYAAFLVPVDDPVVLAHIRPIAQRIREIPGLDPYPEEYYHITIKGAGFLVADPSGPGECTEANLRQRAETAAGVFARQPPFEVTIGPPNAFPEVVFLEAWDNGEVRRLNTALMEAIPSLPAYPFDGQRFLPHISIARFTSHGGLPQLKALLAELRQGGPGPSFTVTHIDLICAHLSPAAPAFERLRRYHLAG